MFTNLQNKRGQAVTVIFVIFAIAIIGFLIFSVSIKKIESNDFTNKLVDKITNCVDQSALKAFSTFGAFGFANQSHYSGENIPIYNYMPNEKEMTTYFSKEITNMTRFCVLQTDFSKLNASLLTNIALVKVNATINKKTQQLELYLELPLVFMTNDKKTIKIGKIFLIEYPHTFMPYLKTAENVWNHFAANRNYYLSNDCSLYKLNKKITVSMRPLDDTYTYIEVRDNNVLNYNYSSAYLWRAVVKTPASNTGSCDI